MTVAISDWWLWLLALVFMMMAAFSFLLSPRWQRPQWQWLSLACVLATVVRRVVLPVIAIMTIASSIGCATIDTFNRSASIITRDAITANEQNRCTVHPKPCLSDVQFREVAAGLNKVSVAGAEFTRIRASGNATIQDVNTFLTVVSEESATLSKTFGTTGAIGKVLTELTKLQGQINKLLNKTPPPIAAGA